MFSSADIPVTPIDSSDTSPVTTVSMDKKVKSGMPEISNAEVFSQLTLYNPTILPAVLKKIADDITAIQHQTDAETIIAALENLATQYQLDPQSLASLANCYAIIDNKERAIGLYRDCLHLRNENPSQQNEDYKNNFTDWLYQLSLLLTSTQQYEEARLMLARALFPGNTNCKLNASLNNAILKLAHTLNENLLQELEEEARIKSDNNLADTLYQSIQIQQKPTASDGYVHRATTFLFPYKATKDRRKLEAAFADYCMAHWLVSVGLDGNMIENGESYQETLKKNCSTLAGNLGYIKTPEKKTSLLARDMPAENNKIIFVTMKAQSLLALNPDIDYETLHLKARQLYDLYLMPPVLCVPMLNKMKIHYNLDIATLSFLAKKEQELFLEKVVKNKRADKNIHDAAPVLERTPEVIKLLKEFKDADINEKALPILISLLELDLDSSLKLLDIQEQNEIFKKAIDLFNKLHHISNPKDLPTQNAKTMATKFASRNPKKAIEYINLAIAKETADPKNYMFRADMQLQEANDTYHYQLALADYYFAKWITTRGCATTVLAAQEINKITRQINSAKEKIAALAADTLAAANNAPSNPDKPDKNKKNKKKKNVTRDSVKKSLNASLTQEAAPPSSEKDSIPTKRIPPTATPTASLSASPIRLSTDKEAQQPTSSSVATSMASAKISLPIITEADYGDWDNDNAFTLHTNRKQKREKPLPQSSYTPRPKSNGPLKKSLVPEALIMHASIASKPAHAAKREIGATTVITSSALITTSIQELTSSSIATPNVTPLQTAVVAPDLPKNQERTLLTQPIKVAPQQVNLPLEAHTILLKLKSAGAKLSYAVGGIVRDALANASTEKADIDIVTQASAADLKEWFPLSEYPDRNIKKNDKLFQFTINKRKIEIWISDHLANPHADNPLKDDALSRGFNIEALYADEAGNIFDPLNVQGYTEIDTLLAIDPVTSLQNDPIRILRAIYLSHKTGLKLSARLDKAIDETIAYLANAEKFSLRTLFAKIINHEKSAGIFHEFERRGILRVLFPEFIEGMPSQEIANRLQSTSKNNSLSWIYINMAIDTAIDRKKYHQVMAIESPQHKLTAIDQLLSEIQQYITRLKANKLVSTTFTDQNHFDSLLESAFQSNRVMTDLRTEKNILVKATALAKSTIQNYAEENHALRQQYEAMVNALQQQKMQQAAAEEYQQQLAQKQAYHQHILEQQIAQQCYQQQMLYQQTLYAQPMQHTHQYIPVVSSKPQHVFYNRMQQPLGQHRNGFVNSWRQPPPAPEHSNPYVDRSVPQINEYKNPGQK
jgi:tRNA nucleotidyltransferase/poly(A) polymerase